MAERKDGKGGIGIMQARTYKQAKEHLRANNIDIDKFNYIKKKATVSDKNKNDKQTKINTKLSEIEPKKKAKKSNKSID
jgi:hypothetical protein